MFFNKRKQIIKDLREEIKEKSLFITSLERENTQLRFKQKNILNKIKAFDYIKSNPFALINDIRDDLKD